MMSGGAGKSPLNERSSAAMLRLTDKRRRLSLSAAVEKLGDHHKQGQRV